MSAPRARTADRRYYGVAEAIVLDNVDPDGEGRIQIRFPWFDAAMVTEWCRVAYFYAGNGYGALLVPEVGDEVLVAFVHGDMRLPIVLGGLYNGQDKPPSSRTEDRDQKLLRTKGGHELLFDDSGDQQRVRITTNGGHSVDLDDTGERVEIASSDVHTVLLDDGGKKITVETSGGESVVLDGNGGSVTVKGASVTLDAQSIKLGGAAAQALVLGDAFLQYFNTHTHNCTAPGTPSGPPVPPMLPTLLSQTTKTS